MLASIHRPARRSGWGGLELKQLGLVVENFDQFFNALAGGGTGPDNFGFAAIFDRVQAVGGKLAEDHIGIRIGAIDLIQRHDDWHFGPRGRG